MEEEARLERGAEDEVKKAQMLIKQARDPKEGQNAEDRERLKRLERIRAEILELKQTTVAEIRSYKAPPEAVKSVMTATFLLLGHKEEETKEWKAVHALVGKTGKESLKRRCLGLDAAKLDLNAAKRAKMLLSQYKLDDVRGVSAGAATFYVWGTSMIEEAEANAMAKK